MADWLYNATLIAFFITGYSITNWVFDFWRGRWVSVTIIKSDGTVEYGKIKRSEMLAILRAQAKTPH